MAHPAPHSSLISTLMDSTLADQRVALPIELIGVLCPYCFKHHKQEEGCPSLKKIVRDACAQALAHKIDAEIMRAMSVPRELMESKVPLDRVAPKNIVPTQLAGHAWRDVYFIESDPKRDRRKP